MALLSVPVDDDRHLAVGVQGQEIGHELGAGAGVEGDRLVGKAEFLEREGDLRRIR